MNPTNKRAYVRHMYSGPRKSRKKVQATLKRHHGNSSNDFYRVEAWRNKKNNVVEETADCSVVFSPNTTQDHDQLSNPSAAQHTPKTYSRGIPQIRYEAIACSSSSNRVESVTEEVETVDFDWPQPDPQTEAYQPTVERTSSDNLSGLEEHRGTVDDTKVSEDADNDSDVSNKTEVGKEKQTKRNMSSDDAYSNAMTTGVNIIIARVYKFFKSEYEYLNEKYGQIFDVAPFSQYKERTSEATGFDVDVVSRALEEVEIQDGGAKKRKLNVNDSQSCEDSERPHDYEPQPGTSSAAQITEGLVIYKMQSKPTADLIIKVENDDDFEGMQETQVSKAVLRDQLKIETDNLESAVYSPDDVIVVKEEIDIGDEKIG